ncbi:MAG TPA: threonine ammonia-lyase [Chloroflexota bacterium]|nr:threonine ammonia-lyase [Chloroflexota bacterium]
MTTDLPPPAASPSHVPPPTEIDDAARLLTGIARPTPLLYSDGLSELTGYQVYLKAENLQRTGAYKIRGAYVKVARLTPEQRQRGVICASAGNHGQGVALAAKLAGVTATIVLPDDVPLAKLSAVKAYGAQVVLAGDSYEAAYRQARLLSERDDLAFIHPFDDWDVIVGQGTVGREILAARPDVDAIVAPVGGGGLLAGIALAVRPAARPIQMVGVQASGAAAMVISYQTGKLQSAPAQTVADGIRVQSPGERPFAVFRQYVNDMLAVSEEEIYRAVVYLLEKAHLVVEPAGAVSTAALLGGHLRLPSGSVVVAVVSGGNVDPNLLGRLIEYGLAHSARYLVLRARMPDLPGQLVGLLQPLVELRVNVLTIEHRRSAWGLPVNVSEVVVHLETRGPEQRDEVLAALRSRGYTVEVIPPAGE